MPGCVQGVADTGPTAICSLLCRVACLKALSCLAPMEETAGSLAPFRAFLPVAGFGGSEFVLLRPFGLGFKVWSFER